MRYLRIKFALIAGFLGLIIGPAVATLAGGVVGGFLWIYVFGDNPWPSYVEFLPAIAGLFSFLSCVIFPARLGYLHGKRIEQLEEALQEKEIKKFYNFAGRTFVILVFILGLFIFNNLSQERATKEFRKKGENFAELLKIRPSINNLDYSFSPDYSELNIKFQTSVAWGSLYELNVSASKPCFYSSREEVFLTEGKSNKIIRINLLQMIKEFHKATCNNSPLCGGFSGYCTFTVSLKPILTEDVSKKLYEKQSLVGLIDKKRIDVPLDLIIENNLYKIRINNQKYLLN